jgi:hypothetical protein
MNRIVNRVGVPPRPGEKAKDSRPSTWWLLWWGGPLGLPATDGENMAP